MRRRVIGAGIPVGWRFLQLQTSQNFIAQAHYRVMDRPSSRRAVPD